MALCRGIGAASNWPFTARRARPFASRNQPAAGSQYAIDGLQSVHEMGPFSFASTQENLQMARSIGCTLALAVLFASAQVLAAEDDKSSNDANAKTPLDVTMKTLDGKEVNLADKYEDKVILLVNVASECGLTPQYEQLQALHEKYKDAGLAIVGVPCNQFGEQEPGSAEQIREFCTKNYGVEFDLLAKVNVNGEKACKLYNYLTSEKTNPEYAGDIKWNFEKFLFDRDGQLVARFEPRTTPDDEKVVEKIEAELKKKG
jgi:glutathione peroxidase